MLTTHGEALPSSRFSMFYMSTDVLRKRQPSCRLDENVDKARHYDGNASLY
jgi:hypothetical protein